MRTDCADVGTDCAGGASECGHGPWANDAEGGEVSDCRRSDAFQAQPVCQQKAIKAKAIGNKD